MAIFRFDLRVLRSAYEMPAPEVFDRIEKGIDEIMSHHSVFGRPDFSITWVLVERAHNMPNIEADLLVLGSRYPETVRLFKKLRTELADLLEENMKYFIITPSSRRYWCRVNLPQEDLSETRHQEFGC